MLKGRTIRMVENHCSKYRFLVNTLWYLSLGIHNPPHSFLELHPNLITVIGFYNPQMLNSIHATPTTVSFPDTLASPVFPVSSSIS